MISVASFFWWNVEVLMKFVRHVTRLIVLPTRTDRRDVVRSAPPTRHPLKFTLELFLHSQSLYRPWCVVHHTALQSHQEWRMDDPCSQYPTPGTFPSSLSSSLLFGRPCWRSHFRLATSCPPHFYMLLFQFGCRSARRFHHSWHHYSTPFHLSWHLETDDRPNRPALTRQKARRKSTGEMLNLYDQLVKEDFIGWSLWMRFVFGL